ncbi:MAG: 23S rRNA (pseudouridine(1915)-N(3))-methyltransferase RlmH [Burkholderiales bacterium]|nr:23S rRNA (pseudouridine(1915)-N(3))-methyltransferase RlmH [Burkholderiales bacterium]
MRITIINIANKMPSWVTEACSEYLKRINHGKYSCNIIEIKSDKNNKRSANENMMQEALKIEAVIPKDNYVIALDERGKSLDSIKFAKQLELISNTHAGICFIIGGADGILPELRNKANLNISLSAFVFPHALVRVIILEQIYRAISILDNHPYHRE